MRTLLLLLATLVACDRDARGPAAPAASAHAEPVSATASAAMTAAVSAPPIASAAPSASARTPPVKVERQGKTWPFHRWTRAEAVTFNPFSIRPGVQLRAYDDSHGESPHIVDRKPLDEAMAKKAVDLVTQTQGGVEVSKCPFPRHAVVLYEDTLPVASINVCFECGDILLWPPWAPEPDWATLTAQQLKKIELANRRQLELYDAVFPKWQAYFRDEVGFPIDTKYAPSPTP